MPELKGQFCSQWYLPANVHPETQQVTDQLDWSVPSTRETQMEFVVPDFGLGPASPGCITVWGVDGRYCFVHLCLSALLRQ